MQNASAWLNLRCDGLNYILFLFGSFVEDTLKKEKQGFSSSYAADTGLKSDANGKSLSSCECYRTFSLCLHYYIAFASSCSKFNHA